MRIARTDPELRLLPVDGLPPTPTPAPNLKKVLAKLPPQMARLHEKEPLSLTFFSREARSCSKKIRPVALLGELPSGGFLELRDSAAPEEESGIYLESPALTTLRLAGEFRRSSQGDAMAEAEAAVKLTLFLLETCGLFSYAPEGPKGDCTYNLEPIADAADLQEFMSHIRWRRGVRLAREAASYAKYGSGSPMEAAISLLMRLPPRLGGIPMPDFVQNEPLEWLGGSHGIRHHSSMRPDFLWREQGVALEYDGGVHNDEQNIDEDHFRRQDYALSGISVVECRRSDVRDMQALDRMVRILVQRLKPQMDPGFVLRVERALTDPASRMARQRLFSPLFHGGGGV